METKKYNSGDWEKSVDPTLKIAYWLPKYENLSKEHMASFNRAVEVFRKEGYLKLPYIKKAEGPRKARISRGVAKDKARVSIGKPSNIIKAKTKIEEHDQELMEDLRILNEHISKEEDIQKEYMKSYGALENGAD
jgi:hypothetical protein